MRLQATIENSKAPEKAGRFTRGCEKPEIALGLIQNSKAKKVKDSFEESRYAVR